MTQEHSARFDLKLKYDQLEIQHGVLTSRYRDLWNEHSSLKARHEALVRTHDWLIEKQRTLEQRFEDLSKNYLDLYRKQETAKKTLQRVINEIGGVSDLLGILMPSKTETDQKEGSAPNK